MGGSHWIAAVHNIHSLLYGNSLLPAGERGSLRLYLDYGNDHRSDYQEARMFSAGVHVTHISPAASLSLYRKLRRIASSVVRQRRWPELPRLDLPRLLHKHRTDVLFALTYIEHDIGIPQVSWIPDFQHVHRPDFYSVEDRQRLDRHFARAMAKADRVIVTNQCTYDDAVRLYPESKQKLALLASSKYLGCDWRRGDTQRVLLKYDLPKKFLLFPCQFWKHKNHTTVFRAIHLLRERGIDDAALVCTGYPHDYRFPNYAAELREFLTTHRLEAAVRVLGLIPRHDQVQLMRAAAAIVQSSLFEGRGGHPGQGRGRGQRLPRGLRLGHQAHRHRPAGPVHRRGRPLPARPPTCERPGPRREKGLAQQWPALIPGPDPKLEAAAEAKYHIRIREFARRFIALCGDVVEHRSPA